MKKRIFAAILAVTMLSSTGIAGAVNAEEKLSGSSVEYSETEVTPRADVIVTKYRVTDTGQLQYRRWNETQGYWVDPAWLNAY